MKPRRFSLLFMVGLLLLLLAIPAARASLDALSLDWWTVDSGGGESKAPGYTLHGAIGQPEARYSQGGPYQLSSGFWASGAAPRLKVYLPLSMK